MESPWTIGKERENEERIEGITERVSRNERVDVLNAKRAYREVASKWRKRERSRVTPTRQNTTKARGPLHQALERVSE